MWCNTSNKICNSSFLAVPICLGPGLEQTELNYNNINLFVDSVTSASRFFEKWPKDIVYH